MKKLSDRIFDLSADQEIDLDREKELCRKANQREHLKNFRQTHVRCEVYLEKDFHELLMEDAARYSMRRSPFIRYVLEGFVYDKSEFPPEISEGLRTLTILCRRVINLINQQTRKINAGAEITREEYQALTKRIAHLEELIGQWFDYFYRLIKSKNQP